MKKKNPEAIQEMKMPPLYRLLLKLPIPDFFGWLGGRSLFVGLLAYGLVLFMVWSLVASPVLIMVFVYPVLGFPLNIILGLIPLAIITIFWARVEIERVYNSLRCLQAQRPQRNIEEILTEYIRILTPKRKEKKT